MKIANNRIKITKPADKNYLCEADGETPLNWTAFKKAVFHFLDRNEYVITKVRKLADQRVVFVRNRIARLIEDYGKDMFFQGLNSYLSNQDETPSPWDGSTDVNTRGIVELFIAEEDGSFVLRDGDGKVFSKEYVKSLGGKEVAFLIRKDDKVKKQSPKWGMIGR